jgi:hypothetical protein
MKKGYRSMKKTILAISVALLIFALSSCSGGIARDEAKGCVEDFFDLVCTDDYASARKLLHPDRDTDIEAFFDSMEEREGIDLSELEIKRYTGFSSSYYSTDVAGSSYELDADLQIGIKSAELEIKLVKNENGFGIYELDIDFD